jgi:hypothetical protein
MNKQALYVGKIEQLTTTRATADPVMLNGISNWKAGGICRKCNERPATEMWAEGGAFAAIHGGYEYRCKRCVVAAQLEHAKQMAAMVPQLERDLAALERETPRG